MCIVEYGMVEVLEVAGNGYSDGGAYQQDRDEVTFIEV